MANRTHVYLTKDNERFVKRMEAKGVGKSALVNLALSMLMPRLTSIVTTEESIVNAILDKRF